MNEGIEREDQHEGGEKAEKERGVKMEKGRR